MSTIDRLVMMANQIAANLAHEPDPAAAVADHIIRYWDPRMKTMIADSHNEGLCSSAAEAVAKIGLKSGTSR